MAALRTFMKFSRIFNKSNAQQQFAIYNSFHILPRFKSTYDCKEYTEDPREKFLNPEVQSALRTLTRVDMNRVFKKRRLNDRRLDMPKYQFMTSEELKEAMDSAQKTADELLQMPPVVKIRDPINKVLSKDTELQGYDECKSRLIFTDISFGERNQTRLIVSREYDGTLAYADWSTRDRMNQIYFPTAGRQLHTPRVFSEAYLYPLLEKSEYEYVLDRACAQFEPDSDGYQRVTSVTWQHLDAACDYDSIRSTRHFGPFAFFLSWFESIDNLLLELIETGQISDSNALMTLNSIIHNLPYKAPKDIDVYNTAIVEKYIEEKSTKRAPLQLAMKAYKELEAQKNEMEKGIEAAHGR